MELKENKKNYDDFLKFAGNLPNINTKYKCHEYQVLDSLNQRLYIQTHDETLPTLFRCYDRYSMGNGLEIRMPFMDYRIVSFAFSIPWSSKVRNGYSKRILRDMAAPFMSDEVMYRKSKIGFNTPISEWIRGDLKEFILDTIHSKEFYECELINPIRISIDVNELLKSETVDYASGARIWSSMVPFLWKKAMQL
jgi:asparagine synthase (glutamine-hydrolysing)